MENDEHESSRDSPRIEKWLFKRMENFAKLPLRVRRTVGIVSFIVGICLAVFIFFGGPDYTTAVKVFLKYRIEKLLKSEGITEETLVRSLKNRLITIQNPGLENIKFLKHQESQMVVIFSEEEEFTIPQRVAVFQVIELFRQQKCSAVLIGKIHRSLTGEVRWSSFDGKTETDLALLVEGLKSQGIATGVCTLIDNPEFVQLPPPFVFVTLGKLTFQKEDKKRFRIFKVGEDIVVKLGGREWFRHTLSQVDRKYM